MPSTGAATLGRAAAAGAGGTWATCRGRATSWIGPARGRRVAAGDRATDSGGTAARASPMRVWSGRDRATRTLDDTPSLAAARNRSASPPRASPCVAAQGFVVAGAGDDQRGEQEQKGLAHGTSTTRVVAKRP